MTLTNSIEELESYFRSGHAIPTDLEMELIGEIKRLKSIAREYIDLLRAEQREAFGDEVGEIMEILENSSPGAIRLSAALKHLEEEVR